MPWSTGWVALVTERRMPWLWPLGPVPILASAAVVTVVVLLGTGPMLSWPYQEWIQTSAEFHQQNAFAAPIAAAVATYFAGRLTPPTRVFAFPVAARSGYHTARRHLSVLTISFVAAYLLGLIPLLVATIRDAEHGGPAVGVMATGVLGIIMAITCGYLIGVLCRTALAVPVSFVLIFGVTVLGTSGDTFAALSPVLRMRPNLGRIETYPFVAYRIAFLSLLILATVWAAVLVLRRHRAGTWAPPWTAVLPLALPLMMIVPPLVDKPALFAFEDAPERVCLEERNVEYCVHAGHQSRLQLMAESSTARLALYGSQTEKVTRVYDEAIRGQAIGAGDDWRKSRDGLVWFPIQPQTATEEAAAPIINILSGVSACHLRRADFADPAVQQALQLANELGNWLDRRGKPEPGTVFYGISVPAMQEWIRVHRDEIDGCTLGEQDLP